MEAKAVIKLDWSHPWPNLHNYFNLHVRLYFRQRRRRRSRRRLPHLEIFLGS